MKSTVLAVLALSITAFPSLAQNAELPVVPAETVKVQAAPIPNEAVTGFVKTFTAPSELSGKIPRWFQGVCLKTQGLPRELSDAVSMRILEVAVMVGAPVQKQPCDLNTVVIFDQKPQDVLDDIAANHADLLGVHDQAQAKDLAKVRYPVQAWYATATRDEKGLVVTDTKKDMPLCGTSDENVFSMSPDMKGGPRVDVARYMKSLGDKARDCGQRNVTGNRLRDGARSQMSAVTVVASMNTVQYHELSAVADYLALVILSQTKAFETCEKMETVANLLVPRCDLDNRIRGLMPGDIAFLKALYKADTGGTLAAQQSAIAGEMKKLLTASP